VLIVKKKLGKTVDSYTLISDECTGLREEKEIEKGQRRRGAEPTRGGVTEGFLTLRSFEKHPQPLPEQIQSLLTYLMLQVS
jgi:hypothetical protein